MSNIEPNVDDYVACVDDVGLDQPPDDGSSEEHTIVFDVPPLLPTTVTPGDSPHQLVLTPVASHGFGNDNIHTVAFDLPRVLSTNHHPVMRYPPYVVNRCP